ncbi:MAG TPA: hypothetical protein VG937_13740 [Polyangiaceae bacterium]|nr:hypothetical protein [Polyangiaceae bacterium]
MSLGRVGFWVGFATAVCVGCGAAERNASEGTGGAPNTGGVPPGSGGAPLAGAMSRGGTSTGGFAFGGGWTGGVTAGGNASGGVTAGGSRTGGVTAGGAITSGGATGGKNTGGIVDGGSTSGGAGGTRQTGGASGSAGTVAGGAGGEAGGPGVACGEYRACGCGCCVGGPAPQVRCYYPEAGDDLDQLIAEDQAAAQNPNCAQAGCSAGIRHACCVRGAGDPGSTGTYTALYTPTAVDRIAVMKQGTNGHCARVGIVTPSSSSTNRTYTSLELPVPAAPTLAWGFESASDALCSMSAIPPSAIGAIGSLKLRAVGDACVIDIHLTAFFDRNGGIEGVDFDADGIPLSGLGAGQCH